MVAGETWSVVHANDLRPFAGRVPYLAAVVDLPEGPRMMTEVVGCAHDALHVGMDLRVRFRPAADGTGIAIPVFRPVRRPPFPA
ncbi:OB-fold domain-containing protein [Streptomyces sp. BoleA5]|uniref:Zn-ribbon domain-containing OB-fold protein n=1 Tax=Streptomyces sp. BoleA5 TaxID=1157637 RepID=UPI00055F575C